MKLRVEMLSCIMECGYINYEGIDISPSAVRFCQSIGLNCKEVDDLEANELPRRKQRGIFKSIECPKWRGIKPYCD